MKFKLKCLLASYGAGLVPEADLQGNLILQLNTIFTEEFTNAFI